MITELDSQPSLCFWDRVCLFTADWPWLFATVSSWWKAESTQEDRVIIMRMSVLLSLIYRVTTIPIKINYWLSAKWLCRVYAEANTLIQNSKYSVWRKQVWDWYDPNSGVTVEIKWYAIVKRKDQWDSIEPTNCVWEEEDSVCVRARVRKLGRATITQKASEWIWSQYTIYTHRISQWSSLFCTVSICWWKCLDVNKSLIMVVHACTPST